MDIAYVRAADFEVRIERGRREGLQRSPVVLGGSAHDRLPVRRASPEAIKQGVREGMPLREAAARCPSAAFLPYDGERYLDVSERVLSALGWYSDSVEPDRYGCAYLDASLWGRSSDRIAIAREIVRNPTLTPHGVSVGIAPTRFTAHLAALRALSGGAVAVNRREETRFLKGCGVEHLPFGEKNLRKLHRLGVRTVGDFTRLPAGEIKLQFGKEGQVAWQLARGEDRRPVTARKTTSRRVAYVVFDPPVGDAETLRKVLGRLVAGLCERLSTEVAVEVEVGLESSSGDGWDAAARLAEPSAAQTDLLLAADRALGKMIVGKDVERLEVRLVCATPEGGRQVSLWDAGGRPTTHASALARLRDQFGAKILTTVTPREPHSPLAHRQFVLVEQP